MNKLIKIGAFLLLLLMISSCTTSHKTLAKKKNYQLVWSDEFNTDGQPDPSKWGYEIGFIRAAELGYYTKRSKNVRVEDGNLIIQSHKETLVNNTPPFFERPDYVDERDSAYYTSASMTTRNIVDWKYAKIEIKAKLPQGRGIWPAFWMLGRNWGETPWPECGEIDIMEHVGFDPSVIHGTIHTKAYNHVLKTQLGKTIKINKPYDEYHIYGLEWTPEKIDFLLDGVVYNSITNEHKTTAEWAFDQAFHLKFNVAVGGGWGGMKGIDDDIFPQKMVVDYVRVYQKK